MWMPISAASASSGPSTWRKPKSGCATALIPRSRNSYGGKGRCSMASRKPRSSNDQDGPHIELVPNGAKEGQLMMLFETYGERYTARRLAAYAEDLTAVELAIVMEAIRTWRRAQPPHREAPSPAELVADR